MKKSKPVLVSDVDFVLLDWCAGLEPFLKEKGMEYKHLEKYKGSTYYPSLEELFFEKDENINILIMKEFNKSEWIEHLPIFQHDAREHIEDLSEEYDIVALTCLGTGKNQKEKRIANLEEVYGKVFSEVACIEVRESKDDREHHLNEGINAGISPYLYVRNAEMPETQIHIIDCWSDVYKEIDRRKQLNAEIKNKTNNKNKPNF